MATDLTRSRRILSELKRELVEDLDLRSVTTSQFTAWRNRTRSELERLLGAEHHIARDFGRLQWSPSVSSPGGSVVQYQANAFWDDGERAKGYIQTALYELDAMVASPGELGADDVDDELWNFVEHDVRAEHWGKATTQATLFTEDRIRKWTGQPADLVGQELATAVFGDQGDHRLGRTAGEKQGWHRLAMGIAMALRNAAGHRIEDRPDHRRYALGVLGSCSLLLTQLRYEHGNRFHDLSPATAPEGPDDVVPAG